MTRKSRKNAVRAKLNVPKVSQASAAKDMYSNFPANVGFGTTSQVNGGRYVPYRVSLDYMQLLHLYRGSWIVRAVVDTVPEDMLKAFPSLVTETSAEDIADFNNVVSETASLNKIIEAAKWGRLFGGALAIIILKGDNDLSKPLRIEDVEPDSYRGLIVVDRWSGVSPGAELISDLDNPAEYGLPKYYEITTETSQNFIVHHSRCLRFIGRDLPLFEKQIQTYWGMSEVECVLEDLRRRDFAAAGIADLISRAHVMVMREPMLAQMLSGVGLTQQQYKDYVGRLQAVSESITTNGILALSEDGELQTQSYSFSGLSEIYQTFMLDIAGACGIPVSRLYGRTITGLGQSGEGDLQVYYDSIDQKRKRELRPIFNKLLPIICMSVWGEVPDDLDYEFASVRTLSSKDQSDLADSQTKPIYDAWNAGLVSRQTVLRELKRLASENGLFTSITDEMIAEADDEIQAPIPVESAEARAGTEEFGPGKEEETESPAKG